MAEHNYSITTNRLHIQPTSKSDASFILELVNTKGWLQFIGDRNVHSISEANTYIDKILTTENLFYWTAQTKENKTPVGIVTFLKRSHLDHFDLGFAFLRQYGKKGYAYEASKAVLEFTRKRLQQQAVLAVTLPSNMSSIQLLKKLDFKFLKEMNHGNENLRVYLNEGDSGVIRIEYR
jgi:ribosomal-protein-alanine N-acetyltransferase